MVNNITLWLCFVHVSSPNKCSPSDHQNVARQWMDLQIVDFPSDLCGFSRLCWIPIAGRWWQVLKWMPSEHILPKYGDVALNNGMFSHANCWSNHPFFLIWIWFVQQWYIQKTGWTVFFGTYCCRKQFSSFNRDARFAKLMSSLLRKGKQLPASAQKCRNLGSGWPGSTKWKLIGENPVVEPYSLYGLYIYMDTYNLYTYIYIYICMDYISHIPTHGWCYLIRGTFFTDQQYGIILFWLISL